MGFARSRFAHLSSGEDCQTAPEPLVRSPGVALSAPQLLLAITGTDK